MSESIKGILSHRKLMELKKSKVVTDFFELEAQKLFNFYRLVIAESLKKKNSGFFGSLIYGTRQAELDAGWMFPERKDLLFHLIWMEGKAELLTLTQEELNEFTFLHQAAQAAEKSRKVLDCFKYSDQVIVDEDTGFNVDWLLKNASLLNQYLEKSVENV